jgi:hypothetical protein
LGVKKGKVAQRLDIDMLKEPPAPEGVFELADIPALLEAHPSMAGGFGQSRSRSNGHT